VSCVNGVKKYKYVNIIIVIAIEIMFWVFYLKKNIYIKYVIGKCNVKSYK